MIVKRNNFLKISQIGASLNSVHWCATWFAGESIHRCSVHTAVSRVGSLRQHRATDWHCRNTHGYR